MERKLLRADTGRPLVLHAVERCVTAQARAGGRITAVVTATDSEEICAAVRAAGFEAVMTSPAHKSGTDRIIELAKNRKEDIIVNVQADEPDIAPEMLLELIDLMESDGGAPMGTLATESDDPAEFLDPNVVKVVTDAAGRALYFSRSPLPYDRGARGFGGKFLKHVGVYAYRREFLLGYSSLPPSALEAAERLEQLRALENGVAIRVGVTAYKTTGIDTEADYERFVRQWKGQNDG